MSKDEQLNTFWNVDFQDFSRPDTGAGQKVRFWDRLFLSGHPGSVVQICQLEGWDWGLEAASERGENNLKGYDNFDLRAKAGTWP